MGELVWATCLLWAIKSRTHRRKGWSLHWPFETAPIQQPIPTCFRFTRSRVQECCLRGRIFDDLFALIFWYVGSKHTWSSRRRQIWWPDYNSKPLIFGQRPRVNDLRTARNGSNARIWFAVWKLKQLANPHEPSGRAWFDELRKEYHLRARDLWRTHGTTSAVAQHRDPRDFPAWFVDHFGEEEAGIYLHARFAAGNAELPKIRCISSVDTVKG
ncbi:hypothetical protein CONLIGDRAFT_636204 [Coniochaeta ligniaria NRRL 30616]|uniref:Uncharacterized protein n=1 Tax=Coniochaeta ligniaria NRRL 30616 TaxID=1408157 RepID=A0A1J7ICD0_9PEZI|nr:hypothetical protein CONLIGDRAFT_636204 [Coniochaeta ligniaria NRRL 30616]